MIAVVAFDCYMMLIISIVVGFLDKGTKTFGGRIFEQRLWDFWSKDFWNKDRN